jgi:hypothetical protein
MVSTGNAAVRGEEKVTTLQVERERNRQVDKEATRQGFFIFSPCLLIALPLALAALLRLGAMGAEFWFDEIWSWEFARDAASPWQILAGAEQHHDNNHKLNTLFLWLYPASAEWWVYRLHSFLAGLATVAVAALTARRRGRAEAVFASLLFAGNYWLVLCSAEARGYSLAVCFALLALFALQEYLRSGRRRMLVLFWLSVMLGFFSHLTFIHCYLALGLWSVYHGARRGLSMRAEIGQLLACHLVPSLFFIALYLVDIRHMQLGGAPPVPVPIVLGRLIGLGLGITPSTAGSIAAIALALLVVVIGLRLLAHEENHVWLFFAVAVIGSPALFLLGKPVYLFERYFLVSFVFFLLLLSYILGSLWRRSRGGAVAAVVLTLGLLAGSIRQIVDFERGGRGHFLDALAYIDQQSPPGEVSVCGDYDFRVGKFYQFYVSYLGAAGRLHYHEQEKLPPHGADWLLVHRLDDRHPPPPRMFDVDGNAYELVRDFPAAAFGGWSWHVYRNDHEVALNFSSNSCTQLMLLNKLCSTIGPTRLRVRLANSPRPSASTNKGIGVGQTET